MNKLEITLLLWLSLCFHGFQGRQITPGFLFLTATEMADALRRLTPVIDLTDMRVPGGWEIRLTGSTPKKQMCRLLCSSLIIIFFSDRFSSFINHSNRAIFQRLSEFSSAGSLPKQIKQLIIKGKYIFQGFPSTLVKRMDGNLSLWLRSINSSLQWQSELHLHQED